MKNSTFHYLSIFLLSLFIPSQLAAVKAPLFCYDYAYKQDNIYLGKDDNTSTTPRLFTELSTTNPITVSIFVRHIPDINATDFNITDIYVDILNIETAQTTYKSQTVYLTQIGDITPTLIDDTALTINSTSVKDIQVGSIKPDEHFYLYYDLDPKVSSLDMPIKINLTMDVNTTSYTFTLGSEIPQCSTYADSFYYNPDSGIFNVVDNNYYNDSKKLYNIPTQVTSREGDFSVIALNPANHDQLTTQLTIVAVDLIDASIFNNTEASCQQTSSAISERVWMMFDNTSSAVFDQNAINLAIADEMTKLTKSSDFYKNANKNTAFRVSYSVESNTSSDQFLLDLEINTDKYKILNFTEIVQSDGDCVQKISTNPGTDKIPQHCGNAGIIGITRAELATCMECVYGISTKYVCSRDNFSIRPEAFAIEINDQNIRLEDNISGVANPVTKNLNLAAGYTYNIEINATNYTDSNASLGYRKSFCSSADEAVSFIWKPRTADSTLGCNDTADKQLPLNFVDGRVDANISFNQVGEYRLNAIDTTWTSVDYDPAFTAHHLNNIFFSETADCIQNSSLTQTPNSTSLNGCNISSNHSGSNISYRDYNLTFHPYKFDLTDLNASLGLNNSTVFNSDSYIYMADMSKDQNMSFHLNGNISAQGKDGSTLSNFVRGCYAKPLSISVSKSDTNPAVAYQLNFNNISASGDTLRDSITDLNNPVDIYATDFNKGLNGSINTRLNLNFNRENDKAINPESVTINSLNVDCKNPAVECSFHADVSTNKTTIGMRNLNTTIKHYYGRTHSTRNKATSDTSTIPMHYEVFCYGGGCDKSLLQDSVDSKISDDPRWFINTKHSVDFGKAGTVTQKGNRNNIKDIISNSVYPYSTTLTYDANRGYPYKATMKNSASRWLIYNRYNPKTTFNEFEIEFYNSSTSWGGTDDANSSITKEAAKVTNRRSMW